MKATLFFLLTVLVFGCQKHENFSSIPITYKVSGISGISSTANPTEIIVYPNPFVNVAVINIDASQASTIFISFTNPDGDLQQVVKDYPISAGRYDFTMDFNKHKPGVYLCQVIVNDVVERFELIKAQ